MKVNMTPAISVCKIRAAAWNSAGVKDSSGKVGPLHQVDLEVPHARADYEDAPFDDGDNDAELQQPASQPGLAAPQCI